MSYYWEMSEGIGERKQILAYSHLMASKEECQENMIYHVFHDAQKYLTKRPSNKTCTIEIKANKDNSVIRVVRAGGFFEYTLYERLNDWKEI